MKEKSATGMRGFLLFDIDGTPVFRVYLSEDKETFKDYQIKHLDLEIQIMDETDASIYEEADSNYDGFIDYPSKALGWDKQR